MKLLVCIVNYSTRQLWALERLLKEYYSMDYDVDIIVHSNIPLDPDSLKTLNYEIPEESKELYNRIKVQIYDQLEDNNFLPHQTRQTIYDRREEYDMYIYSENDHLITQKNLELFLDVTKVLPEDKICGFFQCEEYPDLNLSVYPGAHAHYQWNFQTLSSINNSPYVFCQYTNPHQASYVLTKKQLHKVLDEIDFLEMDKSSGFTIKCTANTDIYVKPNWDKLLCISHWKSQLIQHLPSRYLRALCVRDRDFDPVIVEMCRQMKRIKLPYKYDENGNWTNDFSMDLHQYFEN